MINQARCLVLLALAFLVGDWCHADTLREMIQATAKIGNDILPRPIDWLKPDFQKRYHEISFQEHQAIEQYRRRRDEILALEAATLPELTAIRDDGANPWEHRLVAGICAERIERADAIRALLTKNWRNEPALKGHRGWMSHAGYPPQLGDLARQHLADSQLPFYCLELIWREVPEFNRAIPKGDVWYDFAMAILIREQNPLLPEVLADRLKRGRTWCFDPLLNYGRHQDLAVLFDAWLVLEKHKTQTSKRSNELNAKAMEANRHAEEAAGVKPPKEAPPPKHMIYRGGQLTRVLAIAKPEDAVWISEQLRGFTLGLDDQPAYDAYLQRSKQR